MRIGYGSQDAHVSGKRLRLFVLLSIHQEKNGFASHASDAPGHLRPIG